MVIRGADARSGFEYNGNSSRKRLRNSNLYVVPVADPCFSGNLRIELQPARENEVGSLWDDAESRLPNQKFLKPPSRWNIRSDGELPTGGASTSELPKPGTAQSQAPGLFARRQTAAAVLR